ncbi:MAG TPA: hypothetical protein VFM69_12345 [Pricia sp.]|nr:hypothetical protein [Pricia sp.]
MVPFLHRVLSCLMALLLLASTTSWTVGKHYCMGLLMDVSFFEHAEDCGMDMDLYGGVGEHELPAVQDEDTCCNDEIISVAGQDDLKPTLNDIRFDQQPFLVSFAHTYFDIFDTSTERNVPHEHYPPPLLVKDIQLLDEVFLI